MGWSHSPPAPPPTDPARGWVRTAPVVERPVSRGWLTLLRVAGGGVGTPAATAVAVVGADATGVGTPAASVVVVGVEARAMGTGVPMGTAVEVILGVPYRVPFTV